MSTSKTVSSTVLLASIVLPSLISNLSQAADATDSAAAQPSEGLAEIVVTAARREESQSKVPISVTAFTQESLDRNNVRSVDDIARMTPGVQFSRTTDTGAVANISIRGIQSDAGSGATGIYIDDTPIQSRASYNGLGSSVWPQIFDLQRVEVLRGPQGTLFGAGSEGGTVRFITPAPNTNRFDAYARADTAFTQGGDPSTEVGAALNIPVIDDKLGVRLSTSYRHDGGYVNRVNYYTGNVEQTGSNFIDTSTFRLAAAYKPTDTLTITPSFYWQGQYYNDSNLYWEPLSDPSQNNYNRSSNIRNQTTDRFSLPALKVEWAMTDDLQLTSNTSYFQRTQLGIQDLAYFEAKLWGQSERYPPDMYAPSANHTRQRNFTQEVRLQSVDPNDRLVWTTGIFYTNNYQNVGQQVEDIFLPDLYHTNTGRDFQTDFGPLLDGKYTVVIDPFITVDKQLAWFGQTDIKITSKWITTVGLRVSKTSFDTDVKYAGPIIGPTVHNVNSASTTPITPKFGMSYQLTDGEMLYTSVGKGFRSGGANNPVASACSTDLANVGLTKSPELFKDDSLWSYEIGSKTRAMNGRLAVDASIYLIKWKDIQFSYTLPLCGFSLTTNAGGATSRGLELSVQSRPLDNLDLGVAVGYTHASYDGTTYFGGQVVPGGAITGEGDRILVSPLTVALNGQLTFPILEHDSYFRVNYNYANGMNTDLPGHDPRTGAYDPTLPGLPVENDVTLKLGTHLGPVDLAVYLDNALDQHPELGRSHATATATLFFNTTVRPRTGGITASYRY